MRFAANSGLIAGRVISTLAPSFILRKDAHSEKVIHRDIEPPSGMVEGQQRGKRFEIIAEQVTV
jgi:hypothetical protein